MNSYSHAESFNHKRSNFSSFASQKNNQRTHSDQEIYSPQPIQFYDAIVLLHNERFVLGLADTVQLAPGVIDLNEKNSLMLGMMELLPVEAHNQPDGIQIGQKFYLRSCECNLYMSAQDGLLKKFTNVVLKRQCSPECIFTFERSAQKSDNPVAYNRQSLRIRNVASGLYIHIQQENLDQTKYKHIWLSELSDQFKITVLNRHRTHGDYLNNNDIVLLAVQMKCQKKYLGVNKAINLYQVLERKEAVTIDVNHQYYSIANCQIQYFFEENGRKRSLIPCLWRIIRNNFSHDLTFLIKNKQEVTIQHLQTGLFLSIDGNNNPILQPKETTIKIQNMQHYKTQFSINTKFQPIYIKHSVSITSPLLDKNYYIERVPSRNCVILYFTQFLSFLDNLIKTMGNPKAINENREQLIKQIKLFVFIYQELQAHLEDFIDQGFYFFQYTLRILQLLKILLRDQRANNYDLQFSLRKTLLTPLTFEILKFVSLVVMTNETFSKITSEDHKKTKEIIHIIFVLYHFHSKPTVNLMVALASTDPDLVVRLLSEKIYRADHFQERVELIQAINQIIDQFRRINFDQENLKGILQRQHKLILSQNCIFISFQRKQHSIFDLFDSLSKFDNSQALNSTDRQTFYFFYYLLSIVKILLSSKTEQLIQSQFQIKDNGISHRAMIQKLSEQFLKNPNITGRVLILDLIYELSAEAYHKQFITYNKLNFIVYAGNTLTLDTPLASILKVSPENILDWIFSKQHIMEIIDEVLGEEWERRFQLITKLKFFSNFVNLLTAVVITCTYDVGTLNRIEEFGITVATIYYRKRVNVRVLMETRNKINEYTQKLSYLIVDGVKIYLDNLMIKLQAFFEAVLAQKKRLFLYPMCDDRQAIFCFPLFRSHYTQLSMNQRIRNEAKAVQQLLKLNQEQLQVTGLILNSSKNHAEGIRMIQKIIQDLDCLAIIMQSFRLYGQDKYLKQNIVASMKLKILNIQDLLKSVSKNKLYNRCGDAFNLSSHLFQFILENSSEQELIMPLLQNLEDRVMYNHNIFTLIHQNALDFFKVLLDSGSLKSAKMILKWVGKQIQNMTAPIDVKQYEFLYVEVVGLINQQFNLNLLFLINMLKEIGLHHPSKEEILYSKLIRLPQTQEFLTQCAAIKNYKLPLDRLERDHQYLYNQYETSLQLLTIFRICSTYPHLMSHLNNLLPFQQIRDGMDNQQQYFLYRSLLSYIILQLKGDISIGMVNLYIIFISEQLCEHIHYASELDKYKARDSLFKEREGKALTHFCRAYSLAPGNTKNMMEDELIDQKHYYWQFLMWIPFYHQPEGLLKNLETIVLLIIEKQFYNESIEDNLEKIHKYLSEIKALVASNEEHKEFVKFISNIYNLISLTQKRDKYIKKGKTQVVKTDQITEQIFKLLMDNDLMKSFLCKVIAPVAQTSQFPKESSSSISATRPIAANSPNLIQQPSLLDYSQNATLRDKTHHSVISPDYKYEQSRFIKEQQRFNIIAFFSALKSTTGHRIRLMSRLTYIFLHYFQRGGSLAMLNFKLMEEINNHRNRVTQYREEEAEYQFQRRVLRSQKKDSYTEGIINSQISFSIERIEMWKLHELIEVNELKNMGIILKEIAAKDLEKNSVILPKPEELEGLLLTLLRLFDHSRYNLNDILECLSNLVEVIIKQRGEESLPQKSYIRELQSSFALFLYEVTNTYQARTNGQLYFKIAVLFAKVEFKLTRRFNHKLQQFLVKTALAQLPKELFRHCMLHFIELNKEMLIGSTRVYSIENFSHVLKFIGKDFSSLIPQNFLSQNMDFYQNNRIITSVLNLLQLFLTQLTFPKHYDFPQEILSSLAKFQHMIYFKIFAKLQEIHNAPRILMFQSLVVQLLSFFSTVNLRKFGQYQTSSLLVQRGTCLKGLELNSKEVYEYYEEHFNFCVLRGENGVTMVQAFPRECAYMSWKAEFHKILSSYSDPGEKKDIVFSYSILAVEEQKSELKHENFFHRLQPVAIFLSIVVLSIGLIERLTSANPQQLGIFFKLLMIANLLLLTFVIIQRLMMIRKMIKLQIKIGRSSNWYSFLLSNKKSFLFYTIFLLFLNINSLFRPNYTSLLFLIHVFSKNSINSTSSLSITTNFKVIFAIIVLAYAFQLIFGLLVESEEGTFMVPLFNITTRYNVNFISAFFKIWDESYLQTGKIYYFLSGIKAMAFLFMSSVIYFYISYTASQKKQSKLCLLCESTSLSIDAKYYTHQANHHLKYQHNLFKFIAVFKYVLGKDLLSLQQQQISKMVKQKYKNIFN